ncbi:hypothetical protein CC1G_00109 [Coprinopsis cinerea okayama7|uniref:Uncharacterized protein n=1 Tax=Coprinopsis cinerea (strain Okayama-7 / 130 / ATCC MYA-4618 / FGSC 9003) TaxID=240176 RepID=A8NWS4_COPC7|nr:hypothetical protein CC1G_00109 [Coprinopsis cinerea okayama7\|eukprot:XP_001836973.1 hypothetical protein CC1G_00109 [Coprinopsis cinerea okayama7\
MATPAPSANSSSTSSSRWERSGDIGSAFSSFSRGGGGRGRGNSHRGGRGGGGRGGSRGSNSNREGRAPPDSRPERTQEKPKPVPSTNKPPSVADPSEKPPSTPRTKGSSRRGSRAAAPPPISTQVSTQSSELPTPQSASRSSNRRRRSNANRGSNSKIKPNGPDDHLLGSGRPRVSSIPQTAPIRDTPPHLAARASNTGTPDMRTNIDALVERVRASAMADNRPSTPGSHIDWAGDDDDSLPDLDDWGITTTNTSQASLPAQTISPIIVDGLKPLPEPIAAKVPTPPNAVPTPPPAVKPNPPPSTNSKAGESKLPPAPPTSKPEATSSKPTDQASEVPQNANPQEALPPPAKKSEATSKASASETNSTPAQVSGGASTPKPVEPATAQDPLFGGVGNKEGLSASIHAPKGPADATSAPANLSTYNNLPKQPYNHHHGYNDNNSLHGFSHGANNRTRGGRPFSYHSQNYRGRGGGFGGNHHSRNHSSPSMGTSGRPAHSRPVITGDAISRLARTIVATTPKAAQPVSSGGDS